MTNNLNNDGWVPARTAGQFGGIPMYVRNSEANPFATAPARTTGPRQFEVGALFSAMAVLLVVTVALTFWVGQRGIRISRAIMDVDSAIDSLAGTLSNFKDAETGQRGYLLTGDDEYLIPYNGAINQIQTDLSDLDAKARAGLLATDDVAQIRKLGDQKMAELQRVIDLRREKGLDASIAPVKTGEGKQYMEDLRLLVHRMILQKRQNIADLELIAEHRFYVRAFAFTATTLINLAFLLWAFLRIRGEIRERQAATVAKDNFLAALSHELRTPLTPVLATLTAWEQSQDFSAERLEEIRTLRRCVELEARLIDDLLDLTRIIRGKLALNLENVDVHSLIDGVARMYRSSLDAKAIRVSVHLDAPVHFASADPGRLQQVFWNVLKNAGKFTPDGGTIGITTANTTDGRLQIFFTDSGAGMTPTTIAKIFHPFEQGSAEIVRRYGGLGLGLTISKTFLEAQGGSIVASSPGLGMGSTFTLALPTIPVPVAAPDPAATATGSQVVQRKLDILLVEDHEDTSRVLSRLLERLGHRVRVADSVASAIVSAEQPFDLLLSDIGLPDGTGIELIQRLRRHRNNIPAIALTGFGMDEDIAKTREAGFAEHLTKPINFQRLQLMVQKIAEGR